MSPTDESAARLLLDRMALVAEKLRERGVELIPLRPDPTAATYFQARPRRSMAPSDFESGVGTSVEAFRDELAAHWEGERLRELADLAGDCAALAASLRAAQDPSDEVSPFIYVMF